MRIPVKVAGRTARVADNGRQPGQASEETQPTAAQHASEVEGDWRERYLRLAADLDNSRKRMERYYAQRAQEEKEWLLLDLVSVADNLERALAHAAAGPQEETLRQGVALTLKALLDTLARHGVRPVRPEGQPFDPEWHEAVGVVPAAVYPDLPPGTVARVEQTGYAWHDKVLRPARVLVTAD